MADGRFVIEDDGTHFNIRPDDKADPIPDDQRSLHSQIYRTWNIVMLMSARGLIAEGDKEFVEFRQRLLEAAKAGLAETPVRVRAGTDAVSDICADIFERKGRGISDRYLLSLAWMAAAGAAGAVVLAFAGSRSQGLSGYGWVLIGAMPGAWVRAFMRSGAASLAEMPNYLRGYTGAFLQLTFAALVTLALALLLDMKWIKLGVATTDLSDFRTDVRTALLLGVIAGFMAKDVATRLEAAFSERVENLAKRFG